MIGTLVATHVHLPAFSRNRWVWKAYWWYFGNDLLEDEDAFLDLVSYCRWVSRYRDTHHEPYFPILFHRGTYWSDSFGALGGFTTSMDWVFYRRNSYALNHSAYYEKISV